MSGEPRTLSDLGEFGLIARLRARMPGRADVAVGPGDDAALVTTGRATLAAADILVEGTHFDLAFSSPADAGFKAMAVNVSDIAAMGGRATFALVSLAAPPGTLLGSIDGIYDGLLEAAGRFGVAVVGGDLAAAPQIVISVAIIGEPGPRTVTRAGASSSDLLCVTGSVGSAAAGLGLFRVAAHDPRAADLLERHPGLALAHRRPEIRTEAGPAAAGAGASAMIDVSDGLARDAGHLAEESRLGLRLDAESVPAGDGVAQAAAFLGVDPQLLAAGGGDDYELAMAVPPARLDAVAAAIAPVPLTVIGEFCDASLGRTLRSGDSERALDAVGWEHFA